MNRITGISSSVIVEEYNRALRSAESHTVELGAGAAATPLRAIARAAFSKGQMARELVAVACDRLSDAAVGRIARLSRRSLQGLLARCRASERSIDQCAHAMG